MTASILIGDVALAAPNGPDAAILEALVSTETYRLCDTVYAGFDFPPGEYLGAGRRVAHHRRGWCIVADIGPETRISPDTAARLAAAIAGADVAEHRRICREVRMDLAGNTHRIPLRELYRDHLADCPECRALVCGDAS